MELIKEAFNKGMNTDLKKLALFQTGYPNRLEDGKYYETQTIIAPHDNFDSLFEFGYAVY